MIKHFFFEDQFNFSKSCCSLVMEDADNLRRVVVITDAVWWTQKHDDQNVQQVPGPERTKPGGWSCMGISVVIMYKFRSAFKRQYDFDNVHWILNCLQTTCFTVNFSLEICVIQKKARQEKLAKIKSLKRQKAKPSELTLTQMVGGADKDTNTEVNLINSSFC